MIRTLSLLFALAAPAAQACAVAEGCPMGAPFDACAAVRVAEGFACVNDPSTPSGFVVVPVGGTVPPDGPAPAGAGQGLGAGLALPLVGLMVLLGVAAGR